MVSINGFSKVTIFFIIIVDFDAIGIIIVIVKLHIIDVINIFTKPMKRLIFLATIISFVVGCEKNQDNKINSDYVARIVGFDINCSICILEFPDDNSQVKKEIGESPGNFYQAINLSKGNYEIGQILRVKIRKADTNDLTSCISLYPSGSYKSVFITEFENFSDLIFNDTINLSYGDCLYDSENQRYICLDSVLSDSRCPTGATCIWEGNAEVRFKVEKINDNPVFFNLNTHMGFTTDTIVDGYKFALINLRPYPALEHQIEPNEYKAGIIVEKDK
jgi:hypothetical protein